MSPESTFVPKTTTLTGREFDFGILTGSFYVAWFFGAAYISKLSDYIGRKNGILICLFGALLGYVFTIIAIELANLPLLILARAITGFTAGNQPIAQAALVDLSGTSEEKSRNIGYATAALAIGLMIGPLLTGLLSDPVVLGHYASLELPFYAAILLVLINIALISVFFEETNPKRRKIDFGIAEVFLVLWRARERPTILKLCAVFFFAQVGLNSFYIYLNNYMIERFGFSTFENSLLLVIFGVALAAVSGLIVGVVCTRFTKVKTVAVAVSLMGFWLLIFTMNSDPLAAYILTVPIVAAFAIAYPTMVALFSAAVDETEQGWVMGVTIAVFTAGSFLIAIGGAPLMALNIHSVFILGIVSFVVALSLIYALWRHEDIREIDPPPRAQSTGK